MYEIRIHSRGGQGGVTAARLLALAAFRDGKYATACPFYGAERRGAPVVSYVRIDDRPIRVYSQIRNPDLVIVLDPSVMEVVDVLHGLKSGGKVLINGTNAEKIHGFPAAYLRAINRSKKNMLAQFSPPGALAPRIVSGQYCIQDPTRKRSSRQASKCIRGFIIRTYNHIRTCIVKFG